MLTKLRAIFSLTLPSPRTVLAAAVFLAARAYARALVRPVWVIKGPDGSPYLTRVYLSPKGEWYRSTLGLPGVFLHFFHRSDHERELHNHPWRWAWSLILQGGYLEERADDWPRCYFPGDTNTITERTFHRVSLLNEKAGSWTLFVAGPRHGRSWGFLQPDGAVIPFSQSSKGSKCGACVLLPAGTHNCPFCSGSGLAQSEGAK